MKRNRQTRNYPRDWQKDSSKIETSTVQYWRNGVMLTAMLKKSDAQHLINSEQAFVISSQAIGALKNGEYNA